MTTLLLPLDNDLDVALSEVSASLGRTPSEVAADVLRRFVRTERLRSALADASLRALYVELRDEDVALAESGIADFSDALRQADQA